MRCARGLIRYGLIVGCLVGVIGCRGFQSSVEAPRVALIGLRVESIDLFEQRCRLSFRVLNPNAFPLPITGVFADLFLADRRFASGVSDQPFTVPGYGRTEFDMRVGTNLLDTVTGLAQLDPDTAGRLAYRITGWVHVDLPAAGRLRFDIQGLIPAALQDKL